MKKCSRNTGILCVILILFFAVLFDISGDSNRQIDQTMSIPYPEMVLVEAGSFIMGSETGQPDEHPEHLVTLTTSFYMGKYEISFEEYALFCLSTERDLVDDLDRGRHNIPLFDVQWFEAIAYCNWLSVQHGFTPYYNSRGTKRYADADGYRLPTEAEWEFAARGGNQSIGFLYPGSNTADAVAWFGSSADQCREIGTKLPNELGIYDMAGNLWEWCYDWYGTEYYNESPSIDPAGPVKSDVFPNYGGNRVRRGGSFNEISDFTRTTARSYDGPLQEDSACGFRIVRNAE